jgi:hypothetical protein
LGHFWGFFGTFWGSRRVTGHLPTFISHYIKKKVNKYNNICKKKWAFGHKRFWRWFCGCYEQSWMVGDLWGFSATVPSVASMREPIRTV